MEVNADRLLLWNELFFQISLGMHRCRVLRLTGRLRNLGCVCTAINLPCRLCRRSRVLTLSSPARARLSAQPRQCSAGVRTHHQSIHLTCPAAFLQPLLPCAAAATRIPVTSGTQPGYRRIPVQCRQPCRSSSGQTVWLVPEESC